MESSLETESSIQIDVRPGDVWAALTDRTRPQAFFFEAVLDSELRPGKEIAYVSANNKHVFVVGEVLEVDPPRLLSHTFRFADVPNDPPSRLTYVLDANGGGTRLTLKHDRLARGSKTLQRAEKWSWMLTNLKAVLETGRLPLATRAEYVLIRRLVPLMPRRDAFR